MATLEILNLDGKKVETMEVADAIFDAEVKEHLLWEIVVAQRAGRRSGTASTKTRSEVQGSTKKIFRQKGTGRARHGSIRAPIMVGGGVAFGPSPRSYGQRIPKKVKRGALICALSLRNREKKLIVLKDLNLGEIKTKRMAGVLGALGVTSGLIVDGKTNDQLVRSVRNLANAKHIDPDGLNVYDVLRYESLIMTAEAVKKIEERLLV
ncbi:MAG: 50S ribosomal protein L4 [Pseudomonadota bacterium]